jgi:hypothetical protein
MSEVSNSRHTETTTQEASQPARPILASGLASAGDTMRPHDGAEKIITIPRWVKYEIDNPREMGDGRNNQLIKIGPTLMRNGVSPEQVREIFHTMFPDGPSDEIEGVLKNSMKLAKISEEMVPVEKVLRRRRLLNDAANALPRILERYAAPVPKAPQRSLQEQRRLFLTTLFQPQDVLWIGEVFEKNFLTLEAWLKKPAIFGCFVSHCTFKPGSKSRSNDNVAERKYLVVESDELKPHEVMTVYRALEEHHGLTRRALVNTGGKSIHAWFNWEGDADDWAAVLKGYKCDPATLRASQPVRLPGIIRPDTGRRQELIIP